jgi:hypothetical protein
MRAGSPSGVPSAPGAGPSIRYGMPASSIILKAPQAAHWATCVHMHTCWIRIKLRDYSIQVMWNGIVTVTFMVNICSNLSSKLCIKVTFYFNV